MHSCLSLQVLENVQLGKLMVILSFQREAAAIPASTGVMLGQSDHLPIPGILGPLSQPWQKDL